MTIRIGLPHLIAYIPPIVMIVVGLAIHDCHWQPTGLKRGIPAVGLIWGAVVCYLGIVMSYLPVVRDYLSRGFWYRFHYVQSSPGQATVAVFIMRWLSVLGAWLIAYGALTDCVR